VSAPEPKAAGRAQVAITGVGALTAVGASARQTATSIRAGIRRVSERPLAGTGGDPGEAGGVYLASGAEGLAALLGSARPVDLAVAAAREALWDAGLYEPRDVEAAYRRIAVEAWVPLAAADAPWADPGAAAELLRAAVSARLVEAGRTRAVPVPGGHAAGLVALESAAARLASGEIDVALVGGAGDLLATAALADLSARSKLRTDRAPGGLIPGEGSAFVVLERLDGASRRGAPAAVPVVGMGRGREAVRLDGTEPSRGEGATRAIGAALAAAADAGRIAGVYTDQNGERSRDLEWGLVETRVLSALPHGWRRHVPSSIVGDLGAASAPLLLVLAALAVRDGRGAALVCAASDEGERAAAVLAAKAAAGRG